MPVTFSFCPTSAPALKQLQSTQRCAHAATRSPWVHSAGPARRARSPFDGEMRAVKKCIAPARMQSGGNDGVPIDAPSGVLLAVSSVLAIASVGCVFELAGGHPQYGQSLTVGILVVSFPAFVGLFYAAIRKGQAEAEED